MKKQIDQDERILVQKQKISSEACLILMIILMVSIPIQQYLFNAPFRQYAVEFIGFFVVAIYFLIRNLTLGINIFDEKKAAGKMTLIYSLATGILVTIINGIQNYIKYAPNYEGNIGLFIATLVTTFISTTIITFVILSLVVFINHRKQNKIEKKLDEEEQYD